MTFVSRQRIPEVTVVYWAVRGAPQSDIYFLSPKLPDPPPLLQLR